MKTAVIGCGNISVCHFAALEKIEDVTISAVVDIKKDRTDKAAEKYGCKAYTDYTEMLEKEKPDCVHICTPHYLHPEMAAEALKRGVNVLSEKPCAIDLAGLERIKEALSKSTAQYGVCFQNRYNESVILAKKLLEQGEYGKILCARASVHWQREEEYYSDDWHGRKDKEGGGALLTQAIHTFDLLRYLLGEDIKYVLGHALNEKFSSIEVEDTINARIETKNGIIAVFDATVGAGIDHPVMIDIVCENASLRIEGNNVYCVKDGNFERLTFDTADNFEGKKYWGKGHESLISDFYDSIKNGRHFSIDFSVGEKTIREILSVYHSSETGKKTEVIY